MKKNTTYNYTSILVVALAIMVTVILNIKGIQESKKTNNEFLNKIERLSLINEIDLAMHTSESNATQYVITGKNYFGDESDKANKKIQVLLRKLQERSATPQEKNQYSILKAATENNMLNNTTKLPHIVKIVPPHFIFDEVAVQEQRELTAVSERSAQITHHILIVDFVFLCVSFIIIGSVGHNLLKTERDLLLSKGFFEAVIENIPAAVYVKEPKDLTMILVNKATEVQLGATRKEIIGKNVDQFFPIDVALRVNTHDRTVLSSGLPIEYVDDKVLTNTNDTIVLSVKKIPIMDTKGQPVYVLGISDDITERVKKDESLHWAYHELSNKNEQMESDFRLAQEIQSTILKQSSVVLEHKKNNCKTTLTNVYNYKMAESLGGDLFCFVPISDTRRGVLVCDVMGHGVRAALLSVIIHVIAGEKANTEHTPSEFMNYINHRFIEAFGKHHETLFATALYLVIDIENNTITYTNAGHPYPICIHKDSGAVSLLKQEEIAHGPALGLFKDETYKESTFPLSGDEFFLLFTDGLTELGANLEEGLTPETIAILFQGDYKKPIKNILDTIVENALKTSKTPNFADDVCIVGVDIRQETITDVYNILG